MHVEGPLFQKVNFNQERVLPDVCYQLFHQKVQYRFSDKKFWVATPFTIFIILVDVYIILIILVLFCFLHRLPQANTSLTALITPSCFTSCPSHLLVCVTHWRCEEGAWDEQEIVAFTVLLAIQSPLELGGQ